MSFAAGQPVIWPFPADWGKPVRETLAWLTDAMVAPTAGFGPKRQLRLAPRRAFAFDVIADKRDRRVIDNLRFDRGAQPWQLPIWHDGQVLAESVATGGLAIACRTAGFDFVAGGRAVLWSAVDVWELVTIQTVQATSLALATGLQRAWPAGTRLWPVRRAFLPDASEESAWHDDASRMPLQFRVDEPCDWPAVLPAATYRTLPLLGLRPDMDGTVASRYGRDLQLVDEETGAITPFDLPTLPQRSQAHAWKLFGRQEHATFRSLAYGLRGRMGELWVPSWNADLRVVATIGSAATSITVEWCGYTLYGRQQRGRRDIRIEVAGGGVYCRRITGSVAAGATEVLTLDAALGVEVPASAIRAVSFLALCQQASDQVEIDHVTDADGLALSATRWEAVRADV